MSEPCARPRYVGPATFFRAPQSETCDDVDIGVIGVPFDGGVTHWPGARHGQRAVVDFVGADLVELSPPFDSAGLAARNAANLLFEILCLLAEARQARRAVEPAGA
jgi:arginase family enzyme